MPFNQRKAEFTILVMVDSIYLVQNHLEGQVVEVGRAKVVVEEDLTEVLDPNHSHV